MTEEHARELKIVRRHVRLLSDHLLGWTEEEIDHFMKMYSENLEALGHETICFPVLMWSLGPFIDELPEHYSIPKAVGEFQWVLEPHKRGAFKYTDHDFDWADARQLISKLCSKFNVDGHLIKRL